MGRPLADYRGARRNQLRGGFYLDGVGRKQYRPSRWPGKERNPRNVTQVHGLSSSLLRGWGRLWAKFKGAEHAHARAIARQARNNPTCAVLTAAELDAATEALA